MWHDPTCAWKRHGALRHHGRGVVRKTGQQLERWPLLLPYSDAMGKVPKQRVQVLEQVWPGDQDT